MPILPETSPADPSINSAAEIFGLLREIHDKDLVLTLAASDGRHCASKLLAIDAERQLLTFSASAEDAQLYAVLEAEDVIAVAYLDRIKVQFQLTDMLLVNSPQGSVLRARLPHKMFRFQRRNSFRVSLRDESAPCATVEHPLGPGLNLRLRILDLSIGGAALFLPEDLGRAADFPLGTILNRVELQLDRGTQFHAGLRIQHVNSFSDASNGMRLGCAFERLPAPAAGILQRFIDQTQKRMRLRRTNKS